MSSQMLTSRTGRYGAVLAATVTIFLALSILPAVSVYEPVTTVPVGLNPMAIAVNPVTHHVYVANYSGDTLSVIDGTSDEVTATIPMPWRTTIARPVAVVVDSLADPPRAFVGNFWSGMLSVVDESALVASATVDLTAGKSGGPRALALDPTSSPPRLYTANYGRSTVTVLNASTYQPIDVLTVYGSFPRALGIFISPSRKRVFSADRGNTVTIIDAETDSVLKTVTVGGAPRSVAVDSDTGFAYVTNNASDTVSVIDASDNVTATVDVGDGPTGIAVDSVRGRVFVANHNSDTVTVIRTSDFTVEDTITVGANPYSVALSSDDAMAFVSNYGSSSVSVINSSLATETVTTGYRPYALAVNEGISPQKTYAGNWGASTVTVISDTQSFAAFPFSPGVAFAESAGGPVDISLDPPPGGGVPSENPVLNGTATSLRAVPSGIAAVFFRIDGEVRWNRAEIVEGVGTPLASWRAEIAGPLPVGSHTISVMVFDQAGATSATSDFGAVVSGGAGAGSRSFGFSVGQTAQPPIADAGGPYSAVEGDSVTLDGSGSFDPDGTIVSWAWDTDEDGYFDDAFGETAEVSFDDDFDGTVALRVTDDSGLSGDAASALTVTNAAPVAGAVAVPLSPLMLGAGCDVSVSFSDAGVADTHSATWSWGDGTSTTGSVVEQDGSGTALGSHVYAAPGVYTVSVAIDDDDGGSTSAIAAQYVVVYDPLGGWVTGGGWIASPAGALRDAPSIAGKANFGFVSKYRSGATVPEGNVRFQFREGGIDFGAQAMEWMVIAGDKAKIGGSGTIGGAGQCGFMLTIVDGDPMGGPDRFRMKIWDEASGLIIYDNMPGELDDLFSGQALSGGSIVLHQR